MGINSGDSLVHADCCDSPTYHHKEPNRYNGIISLSHFLTQTIKSAANLKLHKNKEEKKNSKRESFEDVYKLTLICESEKSSF